MIGLDCVATFLAVASQGGFREAARHTGLSQPTVTQQLKRLEQSLQVSLISRSNAGCTLTPEGRAFLPYAEHLVKTGRRAQALFDQRKLTIGASSNTGIYLLQPRLRAYRDSADHQIDLVIGNNNAIADKLEHFEIDVAVMEWWDQRPGFQATVWHREELVLIVPPEHAWASRASIPRHWLRGQALLGGEAGSGTGRLLQAHFGEDAKTIGVAMQLGSTEAVKHAVQAGHGISLVMASAVMDEHAQGRLRAIAIEGDAPRKALYVICRDSLLPGAPALQFARFLAATASKDESVPLAVVP